MGERNKKLHGNTIVRSCVAMITFKDGSGQICELKLESGYTFTLAEMRRWRIEDEEKPVKSVEFLRYKK